jgi:DNA-binding PadR family transcriptional regulator
MRNRSREAGDLIALAALAFITERPRHPYDIQRAIRDRHKEFAAGKVRALYRAVERLELDCLIEPVETSREGKRPERTVYRITEDGNEELAAWIGELLEGIAPEFPNYSVAIGFAAYLQPEVVLEQLQARAVALLGHVAGVEAGLKALLESMKLPRPVVLERELSLALRKAELEWTQSLIEDIRTKRLVWSPADLARHFSARRNQEIK